MWLIPYPVRVFDFVAMTLQNCLLQSSIQLASLSFSLDEAKKALISDSEKKYVVFKVYDSYGTHFVTLTANCLTTWPSKVQYTDSSQVNI